MAVPREVPAERPAPRRSQGERPRTPRRFGPTYSFWLLGAQAALFVLGLSCLLGGFHALGEPPEWSYLRENQYALLGAGGVFFLLVWAAYHLPVLTTLVGALAVLAACAWRFSEKGTVDASRTLALAVAMLALWLALSHRRAVR